jgi:uncharacterized protein (TIGR03437 family)
VDKNKNWWVYCELDQLAGTLALADVNAGQHLPSTNRYWFQYFIDQQYGEVWNGVNYGTNTPQRDWPKVWEWKSAYHDFEHALVGYITAQQLAGQPFTLNYAFTAPVDQSTIHPYYLDSPILTYAETTDPQNVRHQAVTFRGKQPPPVTLAAPASAASYFAGPLPAGSIAMLKGSGLATTTEQASTVPYPTKLGGTTVTIRDSSGTERSAPILYASPQQINFEIPQGTLAGPATVTVLPSTSPGMLVPCEVAAVAPGIFQLNSTALAAANVIRVRSGMTLPLEPVYDVNGTGAVVPRFIDLGPKTDSVYLALYGTGFRNAKNISVTIGGQPVNVLYSGPQGTYDGLDQLNAGPISRALAGKGKTNVVVVADGQTANPVEVLIQ